MSGKKIKHLFEYVLFIYFLTIFKFLPYKLASFIGGYIATGLGPVFKANKTAKKNLTKVFPDKSKQEINQITKEVWDNLGRSFAEFPHIAAMDLEKLRSIADIHGEKYLKKFLKEKQPVLFVAAHYSNWEVANIVTAMLGFELNTIYRPANNEMVDKKVNQLRANGRNIKLYKKSVSDSIGFVKALKKNQAGGLLIDQKYSEGVKVKFLGFEATSSTLVASVAKKYKIPLVMVHVERKNQCEFEVFYEKPIQYEAIEGMSDVEIVGMLNDRVGEWIKNKPEQWFWLHNRW